jgi:hypothetical protein
MGTQYCRAARAFVPAFCLGFALALCLSTVQNGAAVADELGLDATYGIAATDTNANGDPKVDSSTSNGGVYAASNPGFFATVDVAGGNVYTGSEVTPTVTVELSGTTLTEGVDYEVSYSNNVMPGVAKATVTGIGDYAGKKTVNFSIGHLPLSRATVNLSQTTYQYDRKDKLPAVMVTYDGVELSPDSYTVTYPSNARSAGSKTVVVTPKSSSVYSGHATATYVIENETEPFSADISKASVYVGDQFYTGAALEPAVTVIWEGETLVCGTDYTVEYSNNVGLGTATVSVAGCGDFYGSVSGSFNIIDPGIQMMRLYNPYTGEHLYTSSVEEKLNLVGLGWSDEGDAWVAPSISATSVCRLYNPYAEGGDHFYTANVAEYVSLQAAGWSGEGVAWFSDDAHGVEIYRAYNPFATTGTHHYTADAGEVASLVECGWTGEGTAWYGMR